MKTSGYQILLLALLVLSIVLVLTNVYGSGVGFSLGPIPFRAHSIFRPTLLAAMAWLGRCRLRASWRHRTFQDAIVLLVCLVAYSARGNAVPSGDVVPLEYTALAIASGEGTSLESYDELVERGLPYYLSLGPHGRQSNFPIGASLLSWPAYLPVSLLSLEPHPSIRRRELVDRVGRLAALGIGLAGVWLVLVIAHRLLPTEWGALPQLFALAYGLGTSHWTTSSLDLWQHGAGELWILGALERLLDRQTAEPRRWMAMGACLALAVFTRPTLVIAASLALVLAIRFHRRRAIIVVGAAALLALPLAFFHLESYGSWLGAYASQAHSLTLKPLTSWLAAVGGLLSSPSRGVVFYEPVVILWLGGMLWAAARRSAGWLVGCSLLVVLGTISLYGHWAVWWGGHCYGPRYLTDALPFWVLGGLMVASPSIWFRALLVSLSVIGATANYVGAGSYSHFWDAHPSVDRYRDRLASMRDSQLLMSLYVALPEGRLARDAMVAESGGRFDEALALWQSEWKRHSWNRFAAMRIADLLTRTDRLDEAIRHVKELGALWPPPAYLTHLEARLPEIRQRLGNESWIPPAGARASRNSDWVAMIADATLETRWGTGEHQTASDWLTLEIPSARRVRGVALFTAPDFTDAPASLRISGKTQAGERIELATLSEITAPYKGWVVVRFPTVRLRAVTVGLLRGADRVWSVSEARLLVEPKERTFSKEWPVGPQSGW